ncbi:hypothetical protein [Amycolatopsis acidicola]|uniref:hypothetical protein n=1 Tax=Amycolatopsis acidicola TaxID=2596893 RepID=UPI001FB81C3A|nr:hypothetical protein [Amycolatopsis acidicola]
MTSVGAGLDTATGADSAAARTARGKTEAKKGDETQAWQRMSLKEIERVVKQDLRCGVQSYGQVQQFFLSHPCTDLDQLLFAVSDDNGAVIVGSVVWVKMPSATSAAELKKVEDSYGSGDVRPFGSEVLGLGGVHFTGQHYRSRLDGSLFVITETEALRGRPSDDQLDDVAAVADVLPPP